MLNSYPFTGANYFSGVREHCKISRWGTCFVNHYVVVYQFFHSHRNESVVFTSMESDTERSAEFQMKISQNIYIFKDNSFLKKNYNLSKKVNFMQFFYKIILKKNDQLASVMRSVPYSFRMGTCYALLRCR